MTLGWLCLTDVQRLVIAYTEVLLKEATLETRQDTWAPVQVSSSTVSCPLIKCRLIFLFSMSFSSSSSCSHIVMYVFVNQS